MIYHGGTYYLGGSCVDADDKEWIQLVNTYPFLYPVEIFDQLTKKFRVLPAMSVSRAHARMESLGKYLYIIGGQSDDEEGTFQKSVEAYDPEENTWSDVADMNEPHEDCLSVTYDGLLYVFGGRSNDQISRQSFECYNPETNKWTVLEPLCPNNINDWSDWDIVAADGWIIVRETKTLTFIDITLTKGNGNLRSKR